MKPSPFRKYAYTSVFLGSIVFGSYTMIGSSEAHADQINQQPNNTQKTMQNNTDQTKDQETAQDNEDQTKDQETAQDNEDQTKDQETAQDNEDQTKDQETAQDNEDQTKDQETAQDNEDQTKDQETAQDNKDQAKGQETAQDNKDQAKDQETAQDNKDQAKDQETAQDNKDQAKDQETAQDNKDQTKDQETAQDNEDQTKDQETAQDNKDQAKDQETAQDNKDQTKDQETAQDNEDQTKDQETAQDNENQAKDQETAQDNKDQAKDQETAQDNKGQTKDQETAQDNKDQAKDQETAQDNKDQTKDQETAQDNKDQTKDQETAQDSKNQQNDLAIKNDDKKNNKDEKSNLAREMKNKKASKTNFATKAGSGSNVNDQITVKDINITEKSVKPNNSGTFKLESDFAVDGTVKSGDYFTVEMPKTVDVNGVSVYKGGKFPIKDNAGKVIANGVYDSDGHIMKYTFTNDAEGKNNISGKFSLTQFMDRKNAPDSGTYKLDYKVAGKSKSQDMDVDYGDYGNYGSANNKAMITEYDQDTGEYVEYIYMNPLSKTARNTQMRLQGYTDSPENSQGQLNPENSQIKIFKVNSNDKLNPSFGVTDSDYQDVTNMYNVQYGGNDTANINFGNINTPYIIKVTSKTNNNNADSIKLRSTMYDTNYYGQQESYYFDTENKVFTSDGNADGENIHSIGDRVWEDTDGDGIQNGDEKGIEGVEVTLTKPDGSTVKTTTDKDGNYKFTDLTDGDYTVDFQTPEGYEPTKVNAGDNPSDDSNGTSTKVSLNGEDDMTIDSGFVKKAETPQGTHTIGDRVWEDTDGDGIQNGDEKGIEGVEVTLTKPDGSTVKTTTDKDGNYKFTDLTDGDYTVDFQTPEGYEPTKVNAGDNPSDDSNGTSTKVSLNGEDDMTIDSGFVKKAETPRGTHTIGDRVWEDTDGDGIQNGDEKGIEGVEVTLTKPDGSTVKTTTDKDGNYKFTDLTDGDYTVDFQTPEGYEPTKVNAGDNPSDDSNGTSTKVSLNGEDDMTIDSGFVKKAETPQGTHTIGDRVWEDTDGDGIQNGDEKGIEGVEVTLTKPDGSTVKTTTDKDGNYKFTDLTDGDYTVDFQTPEGYEPTKVNAGDNPSDDSNGTSTKVSLNGEDDMTIDSGFVKKAETPQGTHTIGDRVWEDTDGDGIQNGDEKGIEGVEVTLTKPDGSTVKTTTDKDGNYKFTDLTDGDYTVDFQTPEGYEPTKVNAGDNPSDDSNGTSTKVSLNGEDDMTIDSGFVKKAETPQGTHTIGDRVWEDTDGDGIQNGDEKGIEGVEVTLTKPDGSTVKTTTDKDGNYKFTDLTDGDYTVDFQTPEGYEPTKVNAGDNPSDDSNGTSTKVSLNGEDDMTIDSGFVKKAETPRGTHTIGDRVWEDTDGDGIQNGDEKGIEGVEVTLTKPDGSTVKTTTDKDGNYKFTDLTDGDYTVDFQTPEGYEPTKVNAGDNPSDDSNGTSTKVSLNGEDDMTIDSGFVKKAETPQGTHTIGDRVWEDTDGDGIQNGDEKGIEGVEVTLTKPDGSTVKTTTDKDGNYKFTDLTDGDYTVDFQTPEGYEPTKVNAGDNPSDDSNGTSTKVSLNGEDDMTIDSGFVKKAETPQGTHTIGDRVWEDTDGDGIQNGDEKGIEGVEVTLTKPDGSTVKTTTDKDGNYKFTDLTDGDYTVDFQTPEGYEPTKVNAGDNPSDDSNGTSTKVSLNGEDDMTIDSGFVKKAETPRGTHTIGDRVWEDTDGDGIQNGDEKGIEGVEVTLTKPDGSTVKTTTDKDGNYKFTDLTDGDYTVDFQTPEGYEPTKVNAGDNPSDDSNGTSTKVSLNGEDDMTIDSGFVKKAETPQGTHTIGDRVWEDTDGDGIQNGDEKGIEGVEVTLTKPDGSTVKTTTDKDGNYKFTDLTDGDYTVDFQTPEGYEPTKVNAGDNPSDDSNGTSTKVSLNGEDDMTIDSGFVKKAETPRGTHTIGDRVWEDTDGDGIQNGDEKGIEGVEVTLTKPDGSTVKTTTDKDGNYKFTDLTDGDYTVDFQTPEGYEPTKVNAGDNPSDDSNGTSTKVSLNGEDDMTIDSGFVKKAETPRGTHTIGDRVWEDTDGDGIQNGDEKGIEGVEVTLTKPDGSTVKTTTDKDGNYKFTDLTDGDYTVDFQTPEGYEPTKVNAGDNPSDDSNGTSTKVSLNGEDDMTIDSGFVKKAETPQGTHTIGDRVWEDTDGDGIQNGDEKGIEGVEVTLTKPDGSTVKTTTDKDGNYKFTDLTDGDYTVDFQTPEGYEPTKVNAGDNPSDDSNGTSTKVSLNGEDDMTIDSGFVKKAETPQGTHTIGDRVWEDTDGDGIQNGDEKGIEGVEVTLTKPDGSTVKTTTDKDGNYKFTDLTDGDYTVDFQTPEGYEPTKVNAGDNPSDDSNGTSTKVSLNGEDDMTIDSGFVKKAETPRGTHTIGDRVWEDTDGDGIQNGDEKGIEGVEVTLTKPDGSTVKTTTDKDGNYKFTDLTDGDYTVDFQTPEGYEPTKVNAGDNPSDDSNGTSTKVSLNGEDDMTIDSGFVKKSNGSVDPSNPNGSVDPSNPNGSVNPSNPNGSVDPSNPNGSVDPSNPNGSVDPSNPNGSVNPSNPNGSVDPSNPNGSVDPSNPNGSVDPSNPNGSVDPSNPNGSVNPSNPNGSVDPSNPNGSVDPSNPNGSVDPSNPNGSVDPSNPNGSVDPSNPNGSVKHQQSNDLKDSSKKELPSTGKEENNALNLWAAITALFGLLFIRRKKQNREKN